jgi:hypothetical protein
MNRTLVKNTISSNSFVQLNKRLIQEVGLNAAATLAFLIDKEDYWFRNNGLQEDGSFYWIVEEIEEELSLSRKEREAAFRILKEKNFVKVALKGLPQRNFYLIEWDIILSVLSTPKNPNNIHSVLPRYTQECSPGTHKSVPPVHESKNLRTKNPVEEDTSSPENYRVPVSFKEDTSTLPDTSTLLDTVETKLRVSFSQDPEIYKSTITKLPQWIDIAENLLSTGIDPSTLKDRVPRLVKKVFCINNKKNQEWYDDICSVMVTAIDSVVNKNLTKEQGIIIEETDWTGEIIKRG